MLLRISSGEKPQTVELDEVGELLRVHLQTAESYPASNSAELTADDIYTLVLIVGRAKATQFRHLLESFLVERDPLTAALVLEILCLDWKSVEMYLDRLIDFSLGVSWDYDNDVKQVALKILGEYLNQISTQDLPERKAKKGVSAVPVPTHRNQMLQLLLDTFYDEESPDWIRKTAYFSLCRALGREWEQLPSECHQLDFRAESKDIDWEVIRQIGKMLSVGEQITVETDRLDNALSDQSASSSSPAVSVTGVPVVSSTV